MTPEQLSLMDKLYRDGLIDKEVAAVVGSTPKQVYGWRNRMGYPANGQGGNAVLKQFAVYIAKTDELLAVGTAAECAHAIGWSVRDFFTVKSRAKSGKNKKCVFVPVEDDDEEADQ